MTKTTAKSKADYRAMPPQPMEGQVTGRQAQFRTLTRSAPAERGSERAFLASKLTMLRTHPGISEQERAEGEAMLAWRFGTKTFVLSQFSGYRLRLPLVGGTLTGVYVILLGTPVIAFFICRRQGRGFNRPPLLLWPLHYRMS